MSFTPEIISAHNLTAEEYGRIERLLGRAPSLVELGIFSVMWSEHCSYKSSRVHLKRLPTMGARVVVPPGENAGVIDVGDGWCAAFKVESHNHPSFIEPFQGAATGVGGILRDIFTMGARPVAAMNSLRFGNLDDPKYGKRNRALLAGVVSGIAHYGNAFGVATVGGEAKFDESYTFNPLVNAFALGLVRHDQIFFGRASGIGNPVLYVGAKTGRDGIHGATMASAEFDDAALQKRPTVQVGDPFLEKLLLEACLEAMRSGAVAGIQDMGAAGLTSSSCEMAARAGNGIDLILDRVPQRETGMNAYEIMLSESQERMLIVAHRGREREVVDIFARWDLDAVVVGTVTDTERIRVFQHNELQADIPVKYLTDEAPKYDRPMKSQETSNCGLRIADCGLEEDSRFNVQDSNCEDQSPKPEDQNTNRQSAIGNRQSSFNPQSAIRNPQSALRRLLASPNIASKEWIYRQYDYMVRTNTALLPGADAAVVRIKETRRALAMCLDGNGRYCAANPREGAKLAVAEAARNVVCVGARPAAITNCLNFASPERAEVMWSFSEVIDGMAEACRTFDTPVISGNVSFYNETTVDGAIRAIHPTPVIGMVGIIEDVRRIITQGFKREGDLIALLGETRNDLAVSEFAFTIEERSAAEILATGRAPEINLTRERTVHEAVLRANDAGLIKSAHDCAEGGLAVTLAETCFSSLNRASIGAQIDLEENENLSDVAQLFSESPSRIVVSFDESNLERVREIAAQLHCPFGVIGRVGGENLIIKIGGREIVSQNVSELEKIWRNALHDKLIVEEAIAAD